MKNWSGNWSILSCSYFGEQYTKSIAKHTGAAFEHALFVFHGEQNFCFFEAKDLAALGKKLGERVKKDRKFAAFLSRGLIRETKRFLKFVKKNSNTKLTAKKFHQFQEIHQAYIEYHVPLKWTANHLPPSKFHEYFPVLEKARVFAEPVYRHYEDFLKRFDRQLTRQLHLPSNTIRALTKNELLDFWTGRGLPTKQSLVSRYRNSALYFSKGKREIVTGPKVHAIETAIEKKYTKGNVLKGMPAYGGLVRAVARIIFNPRNAAFKKGEILVTGMTRPEYLPLMKKAAGFVTDAGGILSHAAIVSREMKKPCIVGTEIATKFLKDGQLVELNATKGIVKVLK